MAATQKTKLYHTPEVRGNLAVWAVTDQMESNEHRLNLRANVEYQGHTIMSFRFGVV